MRRRYLRLLYPAMYYRPSSTEYTRGHRHKVLEESVRYDIRKCYFTERIVNMWNSLPDAVVNSSTINQFKNRLDRHWSKQENMMYDYKAELVGILSTSKCWLIIIIIIIITKTMFMVLSSWQSHCESSPGSFDECRMAPSGRRPTTKPDDLGCESACTGCQNLHPPSPFIIT